MSKSDTSSYFYFMGDPRYEPRRYCVDPKEYGRVSDPVFVELDDAVGVVPETEGERRRQLDAVAFARASQRQHEYVFVIWRSLRLNRMTVTQYAARVGESPRRIGAVLRGEAVLREDDIERAEAVLRGVHQTVEMRKRRRQLRKNQKDMAEMWNLLHL